MGSSNVSGVMIALMVAVLIASLGTGWLTYKIYSGINNTPETVTVTTTLVTPSVTEVTRTLVINNTVAMPVTVTETRFVVVNNTVVTTLPPVTVTQSVPVPVTETVSKVVTETITNTVTRTVIENQVMYGLGKLLELIDKANTSIYVKTGASDQSWEWAEPFFTKLKEARDRGVEVKIILQLTKYEVEANDHRERGVIQLIIDLGLADVTRVNNFTSCLDLKCTLMVPSRIASYAVIDNEYLAMATTNEKFLPKSVIVGKVPKEALENYYVDAFNWVWNHHSYSLIDWLVENGLGKYFNIP